MKNRGAVGSPTLKIYLKKLQKLTKGQPTNQPINQPSNQPTKEEEEEEEEELQIW